MLELDRSNPVKNQALGVTLPNNHPARFSALMGGSGRLTGQILMPGRKAT
ncbi:MAG TPA: hypothetical protein PLT26_07790 [Anaerolineaceae bacterium]|nr:hypothetical protein [Anaerolineaceae bacterium]HQH85525.1 hypothetical protein [Anaerolineaceae bacterium]